MSDIGVKNSRKKCGGSSFECRTNFHRKMQKKNAQRRLIFNSDFKKIDVFNNATAAPLMMESKTTLAVVTCTSFMANSL